MSLIDTWAATSAGAFSLSENALYTVEAFRVFLDTLAPDGLLSVSRWYSLGNEAETLRLAGLVIRSLFDSGIEEPSRHVMIVRGRRVATVLVSQSPYSAADLERARAVAEERGFEILFLPGAHASGSLLTTIVRSGSRAELHRRLDDQPLNYLPPTDDNPYFFNMLKLGNLRYASTLSDNSVTGNIKAVSYLVTLVGVLLVLVLLTLALPMVVASGASSRRLLRNRRFRAGALYFMAIGLGFMLVEIALIQKFSVYLGHPTYALGVLLFTIILATGIGSLLSERLSLEIPRLELFPLLIAAVLAAFVWLSQIVMAETIALDWVVRAGLTVAILFPVGCLLGLCFPLGMRMTRPEESAFTPWFWALNGIMGVFGSCLAVLVSIHAGITLTLLLGVACYALLSLPTRQLLKPPGNQPGLASTAD